MPAHLPIGSLLRCRSAFGNQIRIYVDEDELITVVGITMLRVTWVGALGISAESAELFDILWSGGGLERLC